LFAIAGLIGARLYHLAVNFGVYRESGFSVVARDPREGGWSVLGGLVIVPISLLFDSIAGVPVGVFWDHMAIAIAVGGGFIRFGCICNGCCVGRESDSWVARWQHDVRGEYRRRIPAQWLEIAWWLLACIGLLWLWPARLATGSYAAGVIGWYGLGRVLLEPLRAQSAKVHGIRIDRAVSALAALIAAGYVWRAL
jgi:prolipoprotein diacylglyceryltransferase